VGAWPPRDDGPDSRHAAYPPLVRPSTRRREAGHQARLRRDAESSMWPLALVFTDECVEGC
jgi:hypothetical protein